MGELRVIFRGRGVHPSWPERLRNAQQQTSYSIAGRLVTRIRHGRNAPCGDCAAIRGEFHVPGCDLERCPACRGQAISCGCAYDEAR